MSNNTVRVIRYIRPNNFNIDYLDIDFIEHSNLHGITILFDIDHEEQKVTASFSICNGDNFDRKIGKRLAEQRRAVISFPLEDVHTSGGLIFALTKKLSTCFLLPRQNVPYLNYGFDFYNEYLDLYLRAHRKLSGK